MDSHGRKASNTLEEVIGGLVEKLAEFRGISVADCDRRTLVAISLKVLEAEGVNATKAEVETALDKVETLGGLFDYFNSSLDWDDFQFKFNRELRKATEVNLRSG